MRIAGLHGYSLNDGWATTPTRIRLSGAKKTAGCAFGVPQNDNGRTCARPSHSQCCYPSPGTQIKSAYDASPGSGFDIQSDLFLVILTSSRTVHERSGTKIPRGQC
jgi:hypothetical protein